MKPHWLFNLLTTLLLTTAAFDGYAHTSLGGCSKSPCRVALTFDDGPNPHLTNQILQILEKAQVPATFFVVGQAAAAHPILLQRMARDGDEIGNHTWAHANLLHQSSAAQAQAIDQTTQAIQRAVPGPVRLFRPPYGLYNRQVQDLLASRHMALVLWAADDHDYRGWPADRLQAEVQKETQAGAIILMHDIHPNTVKALPDEIRWLQAQGFQLVTVSDLMAHDAPLPARYPASHPPEWQTP